MIDYSRLKSLTIPEGVVTQIAVDGKVLWSRCNYQYVSFGDSIAAGHAIDSNWENDYGTRSQYGESGNTHTAIVPNTYTELIGGELNNRHGAGKVSSKSFAHSGDTVADLIEKLSHDEVKKTIKNANLVTICIGANDVLRPALAEISNYINYGRPTLASLGATIDGNLNVLRDTSYKALFDALKSINSNAKYVFTTIYNPYKYLWLDEGKNGFFGDFLNAIPQLTILGIEVDDIIKDALLDTSAARTLYDRVNGLADWVEGYVVKLNKVLTDKISEYNNANFVVTDTKTVFESFPDRPISADKHYNDLVNNQFTRGYKVGAMDYGKLWAGSDIVTFYTNLATKYIKEGFDIEGFATELFALTVEKVIVPELDPHPRTYGHYVLKRAFADVLGWQSLNRYTITYYANGGSGAMNAQAVVGIGDVPAFATLKNLAFVPATGYYFTGWKDGNGNAYTNGQVIRPTSNIALYAQWNNEYSVNFYKAMNDYALGVYNQNASDQTGIQEIYGVYYSTDGGITFTALNTSLYRGYFASAGTMNIGGENHICGKHINTSRFPYGTQFRVWVTYTLGDKLPIIGTQKYKKTTSHIYVNKGHTIVADAPTYTFTLTGDASIVFEWVLSGTVYVDATANWNCHVYH